MPQYQASIDVTIASGQTKSAGVDLGKGNRLMGLQLPSAMTGASMSFEASLDGTAYVPVYDIGGGSVHSITIGTSRYIPLDPRVFASVQYVRLVSASSEAADRSMKIAVRGVA